MPQRKICLYTYNPVNNTMTRYLGMKRIHFTENLETKDEYTKVYATSPEFKPITFRITEKPGEIYFIDFRDPILYTLWFDEPNDMRALDIFKTTIEEVAKANVKMLEQELEQMKENCERITKTPIVYGIENQIEYKTFS